MGEALRLRGTRPLTAGRVIGGVAALDYERRRACSRRRWSASWALLLAIAAARALIGPLWRPQAQTQINQRWLPLLSVVMRAL
jgi:hypothetical protein